MLVIFRAVRGCIFLFVIALALAGCSEKPAAPAAPAPVSTNANRTVYKTRGVVKEIVSPTRARIAHEDIPGYMQAMTMPLDVKNTNEFANLKDGDEITFDMIVTPEDGWIENVAKTGRNVPQTNTTDTKKFRRVREVEPLEVGSVMPDYPFVTEEGKKIRLSDFKGQALGLTFIFTRCPFPAFCPRMTDYFGKAAAELLKEGNPTNWHFLSITFDPEFDTPERLKQYAQLKYPKRPADKWNFVTSEMIEIDAITEQFGLAFAFRDGTIDHNLRTVVIDAAGKVQQILIGNEWPVEDLVTEMKKAAAAK